MLAAIAWLGVIFLLVLVAMYVMHPPESKKIEAEEVSHYADTVDPNFPTPRGAYIKPIPADSDVYTVEDYLEMCAEGSLTDYDGMGQVVRDGLIMEGYQFIYPSHPMSIPAHATHIIWFNK